MTGDVSSDPCASTALQDYDLGLHVGGLFIIMITSFLGTMLPVASKKFSWLKIHELPYYCGKMFGTGVILATALVHMLTPAVGNLSNECLPSVFTQDYTSFAAAISLFSILSVQLIQFLVGRQLRKHAYTFEEENKEKKQQVVEVAMGEEKDPHASHNHSDSPIHDHGHDHHLHDLILRKEQHISTYILELGIASHSIIIGIALGVATDEFKSLLVALVFHQFFEGMALSTVVLDSNFTRRVAGIIMVVFYTCTTPIGIAIGIGISSSFNQNSVTNLITQGVLDSLSAGILLYDGLVNIVAPHFASKKFQSSSDLSQLCQTVALWLGAGTMALIGRWA